MRRRYAFISFAVAVTASSGACAPVTKGARSGKEVTAATRLTAIRHAQVWAATDVKSMDLRAGPQGPGAFAPNETVNCDYLDKKMSGRSPKFTCVVPPEDELKVKFGRNNGEVFGEVAASRLFWALGFVADRMYPVRVVCRGCPARIRGTETASIQRKAPGKELDTAEISGWAWPELDHVDPASGGAPRAQRDALKLLAVFVQHTDSKAEQQRLLCLGERPKGNEAEPCPETAMMVHDLGLTFGHANRLNRNSVGSVNLAEWSRAQIWKNPKRCVANLPQSATGTLDNPVISEDGRKFLADLLIQLTDAQLHDLFDVSRFPRRSTATDNSPDTTSIAQWVDAFKHKRDDIVNHVCPS